jgi:hypothetical protein
MDKPKSPGMQHLPFSLLQFEFQRIIQVGVGEVLAGGFL